MKRFPKAIIVDTPALTDGTLRFGTFIPFATQTRETCKEAAQKALFSAPSHQAECLREALGITHNVGAHKPVANFQTSVTRTVWHHGADYMSYCIGPIANIAKLADLTENERELLDAQSSRLAGEGKIAYGLAYGLTNIVPSRLSDYHQKPLVIAGVATFEPVLHPKTIMAVEKLKAAGTRILYLSRDSAGTVEALAQAAHISSHAVAYVVSSNLHTAEMDLVAGIPSRSYENYVGRYGKETRVVAHDLTELL